DALAPATVVVTGEGRLDAASFEGKVVGEVLSRAARAGVAHLGVIAGSVTDEARARAGGADVFSLEERAFDPSEAMERAAVLVEEAAAEFATRVLERREAERRGGDDSRG
ncbi:MAG TPA: glycerate kinase, partial [Acidimicrobiia bacterium]|nr:glycerate kinase [Acidimicrobiia bacterium]